MRLGGIFPTLAEYLKWLAENDMYMCSENKYFQKGNNMSLDFLFLYLKISIKITSSGYELWIIMNEIKFHL